MQSEHHTPIYKKLSQLACPFHKDQKIIQVCISIRCKQNKLCCLECVDEKHSHQEHWLISVKKFSQVHDRYAFCQQDALIDTYKIIDKIKKQFQEKLNQFFKEIIQKVQSQKFFLPQANSNDQQIINSANKMINSNIWPLLLQCQKNNMDKQLVQNMLLKKFETLQDLISNKSQWIISRFYTDLLEFNKSISISLKNWEKKDYIQFFKSAIQTRPRSKRSTSRLSQKQMQQKQHKLKQFMEYLNDQCDGGW